jgi:hypothetical protein
LPKRWISMVFRSLQEAEGLLRTLEKRCRKSK